MLKDVAGEIAGRSRLSWLAIVSRLCAAALFCIALIVGGESSRWVLVACAAGLVVVPVAWRRKAAVASGAIFATSADYLPAARRRDHFPGELSITPTTLAWNPSRHSTAEGFLPLSLAIGECMAISMKAGSALLDVIITVQGRNGSEWLFLTHRSPGLRRAIADLNDLIAQ
jgi:hypothetical protein